jgi:hypothetical protein
MAYVFDIVNPTEMNAFVRNLTPETYGFTLGRILPDRFRNTVEYAFTSQTQVRPDVAQFRNWDTPPKRIGRPGFQRQTGAIPPGSVERLLTEQGRIQLEQFRGENGALRTAIFDDVRAVTESVQGRLELAKGEALTRGQVSFTIDEGFSSNVLVDFGTPTTITAPSVKWDQHATATPIEDMAAEVTQWSDANNGALPAFALTSAKVIRNILACDSVKDLFMANGVSPALINRGQLASLLGNYDLPPLVPYDVSVSIDGVVTRVTGEKELTWLPAPGESFGETTHGVTVEAMELVNAGYLTQETAPGITVLLDKSVRPVQMHTSATFVSVPVIQNVTAIGNTTVLT